MKIPREISVKISASLDTLDGTKIKVPKNDLKEIEGRRKIFSGEDFKL